LNGDLFTLMPGRGDLRSPDTSSCIALACWTGVQTLLPARLFWSWVLQDHRYEMVDTRVWKQVKVEARESPVRVLGPSYQKGSRGSQKPSSWLSEGLREIFTIITEAGEMTCLPLHIPETTMCLWLVVRVNIV
jgi:hypothetical protein